MADTSLVIVGAFGGAFGVKGEVRLKSFCADPAAIADYVPLFTEDGHQFDQVILTGQVKNGFTAQVSGIISKEEADALNGQTLYADRAVMPPPEDDEYYYADLIGLPVKDAGGAELGTVKTIFDHGAGDLLEITLPSSSETVLLPFTEAAVPTVDLAAGVIIANPPDGLFPEG